jgi:hypothetical protein
VKFESQSRAKSQIIARTASISRLVDDTDEPKGAFAIELDSFGILKVGTVKDQRFYTIKNHVGDISGLISHSNYRKFRSRTSSKTWRTTPSQGIKPDAFEMSTFSFNTLQSNIDADGFKIDLKLLEDYKFLIQFCFKSLGKTGLDCPKIPEDYDFFKV